MKFVIADSSGAIFNLAETHLAWSTVEDHWLQPGQVAVEVAEFPPEPRDWFVEDGWLLRERDVIPAVLSKSSIAADGADEVTIAGLPDPCVVAIAGAVEAGPVEVMGGEIAITSTVPGDITITVLADPAYRPWSATIHAV